jgi:hypothetical protein
MNADGTAMRQSRTNRDRFEVDPEAKFSLNLQPAVTVAFRRAAVEMRLTQWVGVGKTVLGKVEVGR